MKSHTPLHRAIKTVGTQAGLAAALNRQRLKEPNGKRRTRRINQQHVSMWLQRGYPPADVCWAIEKVTEGKVTRRQLRPDVFIGAA